MAPAVVLKTKEIQEEFSRETTTVRKRENGRSVINMARTGFRKRENGRRSLTRRRKKKSQRKSQETKGVTVDADKVTKEAGSDHKAEGLQKPLARQP